MSDRNLDIVRLALQSAVAASLAFVASRAVGSGEDFLAVIAAVLVLQPNRDETVSAGWSRVIGALIGTVIGVAALAIDPGAETPFLLAAVMLLMGGIAAWKPEWRYGLVAVAGLAVGSEHGFWETAQARSLAILIGTATGIAAGFMVWPRSARRNAEAKLARAISICRALLEETASAAVGDDTMASSRQHGEFVRSIEAARNTAASIRLGRGGRKKLLLDAVHRVERLWHSLIILDRARATRPGRSLGDRRIRDSVQDFRQRASGALCHAERMRAIPAVEMEALQSICDEMDEVRRIDLNDEADLEIVAIVYGLRQLLGNLREIGDQVAAIERAPDRS